MISALGVTITPPVFGVRAVLEAENIAEAVYAMETIEAKKAAARTAKLRGVNISL